MIHKYLESISYDLIAAYLPKTLKTWPNCALRLVFYFNGRFVGKRLFPSDVNVSVNARILVGSGFAVASSTRAASEKCSSTPISTNPAARRNKSRGERKRRTSRTKRTRSWRKRKHKGVRACWRLRSRGPTRRPCLSKWRGTRKRSGDSRSQ